MDKPPFDTSTPAAALRTSLESLISESRALRVDVRQAESARRRANTINLAVLGGLGVFLLLLVAIGWQGNETIRETQQTNARLADCTTPGGDCYESGQARGAAAISAVVRISIFVSQCGRLWPGESGPDYDRKLEQCVMQRLATAGSLPPAMSGPTVTPSAAPTR